jgi:hypothetical protein
MRKLLGTLLIEQFSDMYDVEAIAQKVATMAEAAVTSKHN